MTCAICHEQIVKDEAGQWIHVHGNYTCGCGDGSVATPNPWQLAARNLGGGIPVPQSET